MRRTRRSSMAFEFKGLKNWSKWHIFFMHLVSFVRESTTVLVKRLLNADWAGQVSSIDDCF